MIIKFNPNKFDKVANILRKSKADFVDFDAYDKAYIKANETALSEILNKLKEENIEYQEL